MHTPPLHLHAGVHVLAVMLAAGLTAVGGWALWEWERRPFVVALVGVALLAAVTRYIVTRAGSLIAAAGYLACAVVLIGGGLTLYERERVVLYTGAAVVAAVYFTARKMHVRSSIASRLGVVAALVIVLYGVSHGGIIGWQTALGLLTPLLLAAFAFYVLFVRSWTRHGDGGHSASSSSPYEDEEE